MCEEPIRNCKFEIVHSIVAEEPILRAGNQVIPTARRVAYSAFLTARPRLMEPIYLVDILSPPDTITAIYNVLQRRRGISLFFLLCTLNPNKKTINYLNKHFDNTYLFRSCC